MADVNSPSTFLYFAYGSNMLTRRLIARTASAKRKYAGYVEGRRLTFDKVSSDGSGKCDAELTRTTTDRVFGVIFEIAVDEKMELDNAEGLGNGYTSETVDVVTHAGIVKSSTYVASQKNPALRPYHWYKALVLAGGKEHALPDVYLEWIRNSQSIEDPDPLRRAKNEKLLFAG